MFVRRCSQTCALPFFCGPFSLEKHTGKFFLRVSSTITNRRNHIPSPPSPSNLTAQETVNLPTVREIREDALVQALELHKDTNPEATTSK